MDLAPRALIDADPLGGIDLAPLRDGLGHELGPVREDEDLPEALVAELLPDAGEDDGVVGEDVALGHEEPVVGGDLDTDRLAFAGGAGGDDAPGAVVLRPGLPPARLPSEGADHQADDDAPGEAGLLLALARPAGLLRPERGAAAEAPNQRLHPLGEGPADEGDLDLRPPAPDRSVGVHQTLQERESGEGRREEVGLRDELRVRGVALKPEGPDRGQDRVGASASWPPDVVGRGLPLRPKKGERRRRREIVDEGLGEVRLGRHEDAAPSRQAAIAKQDPEEIWVEREADVRMEGEPGGGMLHRLDRRELPSGAALPVGDPGGDEVSERSSSPGDAVRPIVFGPDRP